MTSADNLPWAFGLVVYKDWLYITQFTNNTVCRVDKQTGSNFQIIRSDADTPVGIKIYSGDNQPHGKRDCFHIYITKCYLVYVFQVVSYLCCQTICI